MASKAKVALINTFLELSKTESLDKITVTKLVEVCGISRQTFYYHFNDIDEMIKWAFETETNKICEKQTDNNWIESAKLYTDFFNKYDSLFRCAKGSTELLNLFNLLNGSFNTYIQSYLDKKRNAHALIKKDFAFLIECMSLSFSGLVIKEIQKEKSNYEEILKQIANGFNNMPK